MTKPKQAKEFRQLLEDAGYEPRSYSGRGMVGEYCIGVTTDDTPTLLGFKLGVASQDELQAANEVGEVYDLDLEGILTRTKSDNMGKNMIYYWPQMKWDD